MQKRRRINVRADFYKTGEFVPIAYDDIDNQTHYVKGIKKIETHFITLKKIETVFVCVTDTQNVKLVFTDNTWYLED